MPHATQALVTHEMLAAVCDHLTALAGHKPKPRKPKTIQDFLPPELLPETKTKKPKPHDPAMLARLIATALGAPPEIMAEIKRHHPIPPSQ